MTDLATAHRRYVAAEAKAREARETFFAAIKAEHEAGKTQRQLARELAYSHQRVGQIVRDE